MGWSRHLNARNHARTGAAPLTETKRWDRVRVEATVCGESDKAWHFAVGMTSEAVPKSLVTRIDDKTFAMPAWLATERGFQILP